MEDWNPVRHVQILSRKDFKNGRMYSYTGSTKTYMDGTVLTEWEDEPFSVAYFSGGAKLDKDNYNRILRGESLRGDKPWWRFW